MTDLKTEQKTNKGREYFINALISLIPVGIIFGILEYIGVSGVYIKIIVWAGAIYLVGEIRNNHRAKKKSNVHNKLKDCQAKSLRPIFVILLVLIFGLLGWHSFVRPSLIRSKCAKEADKVSKSGINDGIDYYHLLTGKTKQQNNNRILNDIYEECLTVNRL